MATHDGDGRTLAQNLESAPEPDRELIRRYNQRMKEGERQFVRQGGDEDQRDRQGDKAFRDRFLSDPGHPNVFEGKAIVFEGPEDYHHRIQDPGLGVEEQSVLVIRNCGPVGYPGGAEVVNMQPPAAAKPAQRMLDPGRHRCSSRQLPNHSPIGQPPR